MMTRWPSPIKELLQVVVVVVPLLQTAGIPAVAPREFNKEVNYTLHFGNLTKPGDEQFYYAKLDLTAIFDGMRHLTRTCAQKSVCQSYLDELAILDDFLNTFQEEDETPHHHDYFKMKFSVADDAFAVINDILGGRCCRKHPLAYLKSVLEDMRRVISMSFTRGQLSLLRIPLVAAAATFSASDSSQNIERYWVNDVRRQATARPVLIFQLVTYYPLLASILTLPLKDPPPRGITFSVYQVPSARPHHYVAINKNDNLHTLIREEDHERCLTRTGAMCILPAPKFPILRTNAPIEPSTVPDKFFGSSFNISLMTTKIDILRIWEISSDQPLQIHELCYGDDYRLWLDREHYERLNETINSTISSYHYKLVLLSEGCFLRMTNAAVGSSFSIFRRFILDTMSEKTDDEYYYYYSAYAYVVEQLEGSEASTEGKQQISHNETDIRCMPSTRTKMCRLFLMLFIAIFLTAHGCYWLFIFRRHYCRGRYSKLVSGERGNKIIGRRTDAPPRLSSGTLV